MSWFACDSKIPEDRQVVELGERFGAKGPWAWICVLAVAKDSGTDGSVDISYRRLAADAYLDGPEEAAAILDAMEKIELCEIPRKMFGSCSITIRSWAAYQ